MAATWIRARPGQPSPRGEQPAAAGGRQCVLVNSPCLHSGHPRYARDRAPGSSRSAPRQRCVRRITRAGQRPHPPVVPLAAPPRMPIPRRAQQRRRTESDPPGITTDHTTGPVDPGCKPTLLGQRRIEPARLARRGRPDIASANRKTGDGNIYQPGPGNASRRACPLPGPSGPTARLRPGPGTRPPRSSAEAPRTPILTCVLGGIQWARS